MNLRVRWVLLTLFGAGCGAFGTSSGSTTDDGSRGDAGTSDATGVPDGTGPASDGGSPSGDACAPPGFCEDFTAPLDFSPDGGPWKLERTPGGSVLSAPTGPDGPNGSTKPSFSFSVSIGSDWAFITRRIRARSRIHCELDLIASNWATGASFFGTRFPYAQAGITEWRAYFGKRDGSIALFYDVVSSTGTYSDTPKANANAQDWKHVVYDLHIGQSPGLTAQLAGTSLMATKTGAPTNGQELEFDIRVGIFEQVDGLKQDIKVDNIVCVPE